MTASSSKLANEDDFPRSAGCWVSRRMADPGVGRRMACDGGTWDSDIWDGGFCTGVFTAVLSRVCPGLFTSVGDNLFSWELWKMVVLPAPRSISSSSGVPIADDEGDVTSTEALRLL